MIHINPLIRSAISNGLPIVALESTVITHGGLGYPQNLKTALRLEQEITNVGAVPATIAVMNGKAIIGLNQDELTALAKLSVVEKLSKRDLGWAMALNKPGSTTVAATMYLAYQALGACVFATGGLGGVHRGALAGINPSYDMSADLTELSTTPVLVVCSGVKSILDVPATLEILEFLSVPVACLGSNYFPTFYSTSKEIQAPLCLQNEEEAALVFHTNLNLKKKSGFVVAVPNPDPLHEAEIYISQACEELKLHNDIRGKQVTPWLLKRVGELSCGKSRDSNINLLINNAKIAAKIAVKFDRLQKRSISTSSRILVIGGSAVDIRARMMHDGEYMKTSNKGSITFEPGGVGRNVANVIGLACLALCKPRPVFLTCLGRDDMNSKLIRESLNNCVDLVVGRNSAVAASSCVVEVIDKQGELITSVGDFQCELESSDLDLVDMKGGLVHMDGNCSHLMEDISMKYQPEMLCYEPTSKTKARLTRKQLSLVNMLTPNQGELESLEQHLNINSENEVFECMKKSENKLLVVSNGPHGIYGLDWKQNKFQFSPPVVNAEFESDAVVTGAGDAQAGILAFLYAYYRHEIKLEDKLQLALRGAARTIRTRRSVCPVVGEALKEDMKRMIRF